MFEVARTEIVSGQQFLKGQYQINTFGISCDEVMGEEGLFSRFLQLGDNEELPEPWRFLEGAVGAPKFVSGSAPGVGFRVQMISDWCWNLVWTWPKKNLGCLVGLTAVQINSPMSKNIKIATRTKWKVEVSTSN
jgi:hypothetical protein